VVRQRGLAVEIHECPGRRRSDLSGLLVEDAVDRRERRAGLECPHELGQRVLALSNRHHVDGRMADGLIRKQAAVDAAPDDRHVRIPRLDPLGDFDGAEDLGPGHAGDADADRPLVECGLECRLPLGIGELIDDAHPIAEPIERRGGAEERERDLDAAMRLEAAARRRVEEQNERT
jgi:hypothetical protein